MDIAPQSPYPGIKPKTWMHTRFILLSIVIILLGVLAIIYMIDSDVCHDMDCFIQKSQSCQKGYLETEIQGINYELSTQGCTFQKRIMGLPQDEPELIQEMLLYKTLTCKYAPGEFDRRWVDNLISGLDKCDGELKVSLYEIAIAQYEQELQSFSI